MILLIKGEEGQKPGRPGLRSLWVLAGQCKDSADGPFVSVGTPREGPTAGLVRRIPKPGDFSCQHSVVYTWLLGWDTKE